MTSPRPTAPVHHWPSPPGAVPTLTAGLVVLLVLADGAARYALLLVALVVAVAVLARSWSTKQVGPEPVVPLVRIRELAIAERPAADVPAEDSSVRALDEATASVTTRVRTEVRARGMHRAPYRADAIAADIADTVISWASDGASATGSPAITWSERPAGLCVGPHAVLAVELSELTDQNRRFVTLNARLPVQRLLADALAWPETRRVARASAVVQRRRRAASSPASDGAAG